MRDRRRVLLAEYNLVGAILMEPDAVLKKVRGIVNESDFTTDEGRAFFRAACSLQDEGIPVEPGLLQERCLKQGQELDDPWFKYVMDLTPTTANAVLHAEILRENARLAQARQIGLELFEGEITPEESIQRLTECGHAGGRRLQGSEEMLNGFIDYLGRLTDSGRSMFLPTGYGKLDTILGGGLARGGLITLAARPGCGKTTAGLCIADNVAGTGERVLYISLEMPKEQLMARRYARVMGRDYGKIQRALLTEADWKAVYNTSRILQKRPMTICDWPADMNEVLRVARSVENLALLVVDHAGLVRLPEKARSRYEGTTLVAHGLKQLALSTRIPILALCQLNRSVEGTAEKRPTMANLRDTGAWEEDSDAVILLHRPAMYDRERKTEWYDAQSIDFIVDKNRHGQTGVVTMDFIGGLAKISEPAERQSWTEKE